MLFSWYLFNATARMPSLVFDRRDCPCACHLAHRPVVAVSFPSLRPSLPPLPHPYHASVSRLPFFVTHCHFITGHNRPLAELNYSPVTPDGLFLISACLDAKPMLRCGDSGDWIGTFVGHKVCSWLLFLFPLSSFLFFP